MTIERKLLGTVDAAANEAVYIEDTFSTTLYTGTGASQTITNGIDLATKGGLFVVKSRSGVGGMNFTDTTRGVSSTLQSSATSAAVDYGSFSSFNTDGMTITGPDTFVNVSGTTFASWTFRKQPKFFDIVTYTGTGSARTISHNLGSTPGMIIVKRTDSTGGWFVYHRSTTAAGIVQLNTTAAYAADATIWNSTEPTSSVFSLGTSSAVNASGGTYVAYLFAHDAGGFGAAGTDSVVSCGSFTTDASGNATVNLGWEPQWVLVKRSSAAANWKLYDNMRGVPTGGSDSVLYPNVSDAEAVPFDAIDFTSTGFNWKLDGNSVTNIYLAIRRGPMKTPTDATKVFAPVVRAGNNIAASITSLGFTPDLIVTRSRATIGTGGWTNRLVGRTKYLYSSSTLQENGNTGIDSSSTRDITSFDMLGFSIGAAPYNTQINNGSDVFHVFRRAPGFFDVVCYTGTGSARTVAHNLGVAPEFMIVKIRDASASWAVYSAASASQFLYINTTQAATASTTHWNATSPTSSVFSLGTSTITNFSGYNYVAYLFATCPGVSKVGSYTGSGTTKQIDCGFTNGARFVLIKRTDSTGDWYVWDTARGIISANDPYLLLNSTAAEVTNTDYIDPYSAGFEISSTAPAAINASGGSFIYLAIA
jgi:hypothetical protein